MRRRAWNFVNRQIHAHSHHEIMLSGRGRQNSVPANVAFSSNTDVSTFVGVSSQRSARPFRISNRYLLARSGQILARLNFHTMNLTNSFGESIEYGILAIGSMPNHFNLHFIRLGSEA